MAKGRFNTLTSWSYSVYSQWLKCPFSVCLDKIKRVYVKEQPNPNTQRGSKVHDSAEAYLKAPVKAKPRLVDELAGNKKVLARLVALRKGRASAEGELAFDKNWNLVDWRDWARAWVRIKCDAILHTVLPPFVNIVDWKTGKVYPEHHNQRSLYALGGLNLVKLGKLAGGSDKVNLVAEHLYVDTGESATEEFTMKDLKPLTREWEKRTKDMLSDTEFPTRPGPHCRWCKFAKSKGGPCPEDQ